MKTQNPTTGKSAGLYFHIPFCRSKCPYCHFYVAPHQTQLHAALHKALKQEWQLRSPLLKEHSIASIYFGGGTPSLYNPEAMGEILSWIDSKAVDCEITLEANPELAQPALFSAFRSIGINRLSIGIQSFDDATLKTLGRGHTATRGKEAVFAAREAGFENISIDLMLETPNQTKDNLLRTLDQLSELPITHLSLYNLTFEQGTPFFRKKKELLPLVPDGEQSLSFLQLTIERLEQMGLKRYEISAFGRPSRHNTGYWTGRPFLGFGPSAFSYWNGARFRNIPHLTRYTTFLNENKDPSDFHEQLPHPANIRELLTIQLRLLEGVHLPSFAEKTGMAVPTETVTILTDLAKRGWLIENEGHWRLTEAGTLFYDSIAEWLI